MDHPAPGPAKLSSRILSADSPRGNRLEVTLTELTHYVILRGRKNRIQTAFNRGMQQKIRDGDDWSKLLGLMMSEKAFA